MNLLFDIALLVVITYVGTIIFGLLAIVMGRLLVFIVGGNEYFKEAERERKAKSAR